jgi:FkbM family methyltransferase
MANAETYGWDWTRFAGSQEALKWNRRDLHGLDAVIKLTRGRTAAVQAGGNLGIWPKRLARDFTTVYTFEADPGCFLMLAMNAREPNILKFQAALGAERGLVGTSQIRRDGKLINHEGIRHIAGPGCIPTLRIDDLALPVCDLIYLDVEGWELYALRGAVETIARCRPVLAVEINKNIAFVGFSKEDVRNQIRDYDYRHVLDVSKDEVYVPAEWAA